MLVKGIFILTIVGVIGFVGNFDVNEAAMQERRYCEMLAAWDQSGGEYGWPPYQGREICEH